MRPAWTMFPAMSLTEILDELPRVARAGEVWMIDLGMVAKVRSCLLLTDYPADDEFALVTILPHTTALRGQRWELAHPKPFLKPGAFHLQQVQSVSISRLERRLGVLTPAELTLVRDGLADYLGL